MNTVNLLNNQNLIIPTNWFISNPSLYGGQYFWDVIGGKAASFVTDTPGNVIEWKGYSDKPGTLGGCLSSKNIIDAACIRLNTVIAKPVTVTFWIKIYSYNSSGYILEIGGGFVLRVAIYDKLRLSSGTPSIESFPLNQWIHLAMTSPTQSSKIASAYMNGRLMCTNTTASTVSSLTVSSVLNSGLLISSTRQIKADIDDIMIFDSILSEEAIRRIYQNSFNRKANMSQFLHGSNSSVLQSYLINMLMGGQF